MSENRSYYGRPVLKEPAWRVPDVPGYLFLGGLAGASAGAAALCDLTGRAGLCRTYRAVAAGAAVSSVGALIHDLGRPARFLYMLRVFKPTSPLSVGSWILAPFGGLATAAAAAEFAGRARWARPAGIGAGVLGPAMCTYTAVLLADTAVPAWHSAYRELPFVFAGSALTSAAGAGLLCGGRAEHEPARRMGWLGAGIELVASGLLERAHGLAGEPYRTGRARRLLRAATGLTIAGAGLSAAGRRSRVATGLAGAAYLAAGLCTRFGVFDAGIRSTRDPKYVVTPQRDRLTQTT
ncbi:MAG: polysulfide reductase [Streptosporangiales bacterium]|nr:polysulfide reductase [Streptosporangiales bacterium]